VNTGSKAQKLREIQELEFVLTEINLFLDTHPQDKTALNDFVSVRNKWEEAVRQYEESYGPLTAASEAAAGGCWQWIEEPWPWEE